MKTTAIASLAALLTACAAAASEAEKQGGLELKLLVVKTTVRACKTFKLPVPYKLVKNRRGGFRYVARGTPGYEKMQGTERTEVKISKPLPGYPCTYYAVSKEGRLERFAVPGGYDAVQGRETALEQEVLRVHLTNTGQDTLLSPLPGNARTDPRLAVKLRVFDAAGTEIENRRRPVTVPLAEARRYIPAEEIEGLRTYDAVLAGGGKQVAVPADMIEKHVPEGVRKRAKWLRGFRKPAGAQDRPGGGHPLRLDLFPAGRTLEFDMGALPLKGASPRAGLQIPADGKYRVRAELVYPERGIRVPGARIFSGKLVSNTLELECRKYAKPNIRPRRPRPAAGRPRSPETF
jgi:hypothetical protein